MLHYRIQIAVRSFTGAEKVNKTNYQPMPENGRVTVDCNALKKGQYYKISLAELDKVVGESPVDDAPDEPIKPEPKFDQQAFVPTMEPKQDQSPDQALSAL